MIIFTDEIKNFIFKNYKGIGNEKLKELVNEAFKINLTREQIKNFKNKYKLDSGLTGHFPKGHISHNKGKKMPPEVYEKVKATMFKKGCISQNKRPIGSERVGKDGYLLIKVEEPNIWQSKNVYLYEKHYGIKVPKGYNVVFLDKNNRNFNIENLALVSNKELARLNKNHRLSTIAEISKVNISLTKLENKLREVKNDTLRRNV